MVLTDDSDDAFVQPKKKSKKRRKKENKKKKHKSQSSSSSLQSSSSSSQSQLQLQSQSQSQSPPSKKQKLRYKDPTRAQGQVQEDAHTSISASAKSRSRSSTKSRKHDDSKRSYNSSRNTQNGNGTKSRKRTSSNYFCETGAKTKIGRHELPLPDIKSPLDIKWLQRFSPCQDTPLYSPCYILKDHNRDDSGFESDSDEEEVAIEFISAPSHNRNSNSKVKKRSTARPQKLISFHGNTLSDYDHDDIIRAPWCEKIMKKYLTQQQVEYKKKYNTGFDVSVERDYLTQVLKRAKHNGGYRSDDGDGDGGSDNNVGDDDRINHGSHGGVVELDEDDSDSNSDLDAVVDTKKRSNDAFTTLDNYDDDGIGNDFIHGAQPISSKIKNGKGDGDEKDHENNWDDSDDLEEPYTQAPIGLDIEDSDDDELFFRREISRGNEPIRPGDVIEYYNPIFVKGSAQGRRIATILSVDPKRQFILNLNNNEYLPEDTEIKRIKTMEKIQGKKCLVPHAGVFREIQDFKLLKYNQPKDLIVETEGDRVAKILQKNMEKVRKKAGKAGFAPMDMIRKYGKNGDDYRYKDTRISEHSVTRKDDVGNDDESDKSQSDSDSDDSIIVGTKMSDQYRHLTKQRTDISDIRAYRKESSSRQDDESGEEDDESFLGNCGSKGNSKTVRFEGSKSSSKLTGDFGNQGHTVLRRCVDDAMKMGSYSDSDSDGILPPYGKTLKNKPKLGLNLGKDRLLSLQDSDSESEGMKSNYLPKSGLKYSSANVSNKRGTNDSIHNSGRTKSSLNYTDIDGLSDDDSIPQAMFTKEEKGKQKSNEHIKSSKSPRSWRARKEKQESRRKADSQDSMTFHSDSSTGNKNIHNGHKQGSSGNSLSLDDSSSESDSPPQHTRIANRKRKSVTDALDESDDTIKNDLHRRRKFPKVANTPIRITVNDRNHNNNQSRSFSSKSCETKSIRNTMVKPPLRISVRKYN